MKFYLKLARRNIFRNRKRTFLTGLIIGIGLASMMFTDALVVGMKENMIRSVTSSFLGDAQVHYEGYLDSRDAEETIRRPEELKKRLAEHPQVAHITERVMSFATISSPSDIASIVLYGIDPETERNISKIDDAVEEGTYLKGGEEDEVSKGILIGHTLADRLEVGKGDRIVISVSNVKSGDLAQDMFRVAGIYRMQIDEMDTSMAFVPISHARELIGVEGEAHEIALSFHDVEYAGSHGGRFSKEYSLFGNTAKTWPQLVPEMKRMLDMSDFSITVVMVIVFALIIFGIVNTLFMSLFERIFEFGVLRAVGTRPSKLRTLIVFEAGFLALYSIAIGVLLGALLIYIGSIYGMNLSGVEFAGATFTEEIHTVFKLRQFTLHPFFIFIFTVLVSVFPARYAGKMSITQALHKTL